MPAEPGVIALTVSPVECPAWPAFVLVSDHPELVELEPNDSATLANDLPLPSGVTGQFLTHSDKDWYRLRVAKGDRLRFRSQAAEVGSPADVLLTVRDAAGRELATSDPEKLSPRLDWTRPPTVSSS